MKIDEDLRRVLIKHGSFDDKIIKELELFGKIIPNLENIVSFHNPSEKPLRYTPDPDSYTSKYSERFFPPKIRYI